MMRRLSVTALMLAFGLGGTLLLAAGTKRYLKKETAADMKPAKKVFLGWVDLHPEDWSVHGYSTREEWEQAIVRINAYFHRMCQTKWLNDRDVVFAKDVADENAAGYDLYIRFTKIGIDYDNYDLILGIEFINPGTNTVLGSIPVHPYYGDDWGFEKYIRAALEEVNLKLQIEITGQQRKR